jgi:glycosyltransferase involved in cell wall biosynthesis
VSDGAPIRLAFTIISRRRWAGGYNYLRNLFTALNDHCPGAVTPVVFAGLADDVADLDDLGRIGGVETVRSPAFDQSAVAVAGAFLLGRDRAAVAEFQRHRIDAVFESARFFGWRLPYPALAWVPDLQHRQLPKLFPTLARWRRELGFRAQIGSGRTILLSSRSAERDCLTFYPNAKGKTVVVRFATRPPPALLAQDPGEVIAGYGLPANYFYLPNQFYAHKNHALVAVALKILAGQGREAVVAVSGSKHDARGSHAFDAVMRMVRELGLESSFHYLGVIPIAHVYALLRGAVALVNPSRFEGWSTTVEEAKAFGVPLLLSDIDVHREQAGGHALFFPVDDAATLAKHLASLMSSEAGIRDLSPLAEEQVGRFAQDFVAVVQGLVTARPR